VEVLHAKKGFFQLSHFDADHKDGFRPQANLSHVEDPNANVPAAPPLVTTKEPDENEDEDEIVFTDSAWWCIVPNAPNSETTWIVPHAPNDDKALSTWCRVTDEDEVYYENSAWCCVVPNAPNSDTTFTHVPATMNDDDKIVHDAKILHKETSSAEFVSICEKNENCDTDHIPKSLSNNGGLWHG
jgi:hypothetical protein